MKLLLLSIATCAIGSAACTAVAQPATPPWEWSDDEIALAVNRVRAGRDLNPSSWPGDARLAVLLSFDVDTETSWLRNGDTNVGGLSQGQYGARVALGRILALLDEHEIPASFFGPAVSFSLAPEMIPAIQASGRHEIGIHGWIHERNAELPRPVGYRAPSWNFSASTLELLLDMGFLYASSLMADDRPYELNANGEPTGLVELPVDWILDDAPLMNPLNERYSNPRDVLQVFKDEFDVAYEEGTTFVLTMHPKYTGHRSRIVVLRELIEHMKARPDVWFGTHEAAVRWVRRQAGME